MDNFKQRAENFKARQDTPYIVLHIDLSAAHQDLCLNASGDILKVITATDNKANLTVKLNSPAASPIPLMRFRRVESFFQALYITNTAQAGKILDLLIGVKQFFNLDDFFFTEPIVEDIDFCIIAPDLVVQYHDDDIYIFHVDPVKYPYGIKIVSVEITLRNNGSNTLVYEEWKDNGNLAPTFLNNIETVSTLVGEGHKKVSGAAIDDSDIASGNYIYVNLVTIDVPWVAGKIVFYPKVS